MGSQVAFALFSLIVIIAAWRVVTSHNIMRSALALVIVLAGMAPLFLMLAAEFVAVVQVLVYIGAVVVLFLFGIMLTKTPMDRTTDMDNDRRLVGFVVAVGLFAALWSAIASDIKDVKVMPTRIGRTVDVGGTLLRDNVLAFEAISVLLLAALIGAIVLARRD